MRRARDIFEQENYRGTGTSSLSGVKLALIICSVISLFAAIFIVANFGAVTARIAIFVAGLLTTGVPILVTIAVAIYFIARLKWKLRGRFYGRW